eukprot:4579554-Prymnesium_polylepis.1
MLAPSLFDRPPAHSGRSCCQALVDCPRVHVVRQLCRRFSIDSHSFASTLANGSSKRHALHSLLVSSLPPAVRTTAPPQPDLTCKAAPLAAAPASSPLAVAVVRCSRQSGHIRTIAPPLVVRPCPVHSVLTHVGDGLQPGFTLAVLKGTRNGSGLLCPRIQFCPRRRV